jgi:hypothetical protein
MTLWIRLTIGIIVFSLSIGLIVYEIVVGLIQRKKLKRAADESWLRITLSLDYAGVFRVGVLLFIFIVISLVYLKQDLLIGTVFFIVCMSIAAAWIVSRPKEIGIKLAPDRILLLDTTEKTIQSIRITNTSDVETLDVEFVDVRGRITSLEIDKTEQNISKIELVKERLGPTKI